MNKEIVTDWTPYAPEFTREEFECKHTGECEMRVDFMDALHRLRIHYGKPMRITSGYRSPEHPIEARKPKPGAHAMGICCDVGVSGENALNLIELALAHGFTGLGVNQKGSARFIHLDMGTVADGLPRPIVWSY